MSRWAERTFRLIWTRIARISVAQSVVNVPRIVPAPALDPRSEDLRAALDAVGFAPRDAKDWMLHVRHFCETHGGERRYPELLDLAARSLAVLEAKSVAKT